MKIAAWLLLAAALGHGGTASGLRAYDRGEHQKAFQIWFADSQAGNRESQYHLALLYRDGQGVTKDLAEARKWIERSAQAGCDFAQEEFGRILDRGTGGSPDPVQARAWFERAVQQDNRGAMNELGLLYYRGRGTPVDDARAFDLFLRASSQSRAAMFNLGLMYELGRGRPKDIVEAAAWYSMAAKKGERGAAEERDAMLGMLSPEEKLRVRSREAALNRSRMFADWRINGMHYLYLMRVVLTFLYGSVSLIGYFWRKKRPHVEREFTVAKSRWRRTFLWYRPWGVMGWLLHALYFVVLAVAVVSAMALATLPIDDAWLAFAITLLAMLAIAHWVAIHRDRATFAETGR